MKRAVDGKPAWQLDIPLHGTPRNEAGSCLQQGNGHGGARSVAHRAFAIATTTTPRHVFLIGRGVEKRGVERQPRKLGKRGESFLPFLPRPKKGGHHPPVDYCPA